MAHPLLNCEALHFYTNAQLLKQLLQQKNIQYGHTLAPLGRFLDALCYKGHAHQLYSFKLPYKWPKTY